MSNLETLNPKDDIFYQMDKQAKTGKRFISVIVVFGFIIMGLNFLSSIITEKLGLSNIIALIFGIIVYVNLYAGRVWAKWLYIAFQFIGILMNGAVILSSLNMSLHLGTVVWILYFVGIAYSVSVIVLLLASKSVNEFLYRQVAG